VNIDEYNDLGGDYPIYNALDEEPLIIPPNLFHGHDIPWKMIANHDHHYQLSFPW
jgi:hypothetical protein